MRSIWQRLKNNLGLKIAALFFAIIIWSFIIIVNDPLRIRTIADVPLVVLGLENLEEAGLIVQNDEVFDSVTVDVDAKISETNRVNVGAVTVTADLRGIQREGQYEIFLSGETTVGTVAAVSPSVIVLDVDARITREIPVSYAYEGQMDESLYHLEPTLSTPEIEITGAQSDIERVTSAVCVINLSNVTENVSSSYPLKLLDKDNQEIASDLFVNTLPVVTVQMQVFAKKSLDISSDPAVCIEDVSAVASGYQVSNISFSQTRITVYGTKEALADLENVVIRPVSVNNLRATKTFEVELLLPEGVTQISQTPVSMTVTITKAQE